MRQAHTHLIRGLDRLLRESGIEAEVRPTKKHVGVYIRGRLVTVLSRGAHSGHKDLGLVRSIIRREQERVR